MGQQIVVGFDGSPAAAAAMRWAADEAVLRGAELAAWMVHDARERHEPDVGGVAAVAAAFPVAARTVMVHHVEGDPARVLLDASRGADLLVLGSRGRGPVAGLLLGSVSLRCLTRASCPVVVIRPDLPASSRRRVLVGVDGSAHSQAALRVAAAEARLRGAVLHAVHAVHWANTGDALISPDRRQLIGWGRQLVSAELAATGVHARVVVVAGRPEEVLVKRSRGAELLVVGSRGRGCTAGMLLGSTSERCAHGAACPVMVVPDRHASSVEPSERVAAGSG